MNAFLAEGGWWIVGALALMAALVPVLGTERRGLAIVGLIVAGCLALLQLYLVSYTGRDLSERVACILFPEGRYCRGDTGVPPPTRPWETRIDAETGRCQIRVRGDLSGAERGAAYEEAAAQCRERTARYRVVFDEETGQCSYVIRSDLQGEALEAAQEEASAECARHRPAYETRIDSETGRCQIRVRQDLLGEARERARDAASAECASRTRSSRPWRIAVDPGTGRCRIDVRSDLQGAERERAYREAGAACRNAR